MSAELLSRIQFAFTISFHILFPAFSIGLVTFLVIMEAMWLKTKNRQYYRICRFWAKIFALTFGMGIVSGIVMEFQLGTNWSHYAHAVGPVLGSLFTYEVMTAFFVEAGFLGIVIFGWQRVSPALHFVATCCVLLGVTLSAFWILSANSWMQFPTGAHLVNGVFQPDNWWKIIFNPMVIPRYVHMMLSCYLTTALVIAGVSAFYLLKRQHLETAKITFSFAVWVITIAAPLQIFVGDGVGVAVHEHQPIKTAAIEANWKTQAGAPLVLFAIPDQKTGKNLYAITIPKVASLINTHHWNGVLQGLDSVPKSDQPPVAVVFYTFRIMVGLGLLFLLYGIVSLFLRYKKSLCEKRQFLRFALLCSPLGFVALEAGWITAEVGRQPWVVQGVLRTAKAASNIPASSVWISFAIVVLVYGVIFGYFYFRYFLKTLRKGPEALEENEKMPFGYMHAPEIKEEKGGQS